MPRTKKGNLRPIERIEERTLDKKELKEGRTKETLSYSRLRRV
jgi:hypothetical protein